MKKISFIAMALCLCASAFAYEQVGQLNPYAYGVNPQVKNAKVGLSYQLNAPATATEIVIYCDGEEVSTQAVDDNTVGLHSAVIDLSNATKGGKYTFGIRVHGTSVETPTQLMCIKDGATDTTAVYYAFYHPSGVDVDRNPFSENFGRILCTESMVETPDAGYHSSGDKQAVYAFDPTFAPIPNGNALGFKGGHAFGNDYAPYRVRITDDSRIFVTDNCISDGTSLWELSQDLQTWTPIFEGAFDTDGVMWTTDGSSYLTAANAGFDVVGKGEDLQLFMLNFSTPGLIAYSGTGFFYSQYNLGTATSWTTAPTYMDSLNNLCGDQVVPVSSNCGIAADGEGGFWFKSARANVCAQRGFCHVNAEGVVDFEYHATAADTAKYLIHANGSNAGKGIRVIGDQLFVGMGRSKAGVGRMLIYDIVYDATGAPDLEVNTELYIKEISTNLNDFAVDYANNLYVIGNSNEKLVPVILPYSGVVETPINAEVIVEVSAVENVEAAPAVEKIFRNGQVVIVKDGVEYNAIGTRL